MTLITHGRSAPTHAAAHRQPIGRTQQLTLAVAALATLTSATSCGGDDDGPSSDPTPTADPTTTGGSLTTDASHY